jgi:hypothetical protein
MSGSGRPVLSILFDENVNRRIIRGLESRPPDLDSVTVQQIGLGGRPDPEILEWAAANRRILVTHGLRTMPRHAAERVRAGQEMPGVSGVPKRLPQDDSNSVRSARRIRIGYKVPDFSPVVRLMSYPYFQPFGSSRKASST